jgi:formate hydrogenlyase subunit 3/multisubunit Na+/H+ antiporter MnhD subunit
MIPPAAPSFETTPAGVLLVLALVVPVGGAVLAFVLGGRYVERIAALAVVLGTAVAAAVAVDILRSGRGLVYLLGAWTPPLGVALRADGPAAAMMATAAAVICAVAVYARADFHTPPDADDARTPFAFWILLLGIWGALNAIFVSGDLFTLYVGLELLTFAAVPLVCLDGRAETLTAALRYLLFALVGSVLYLIGAALLYGAYGTLDIVLLAERVRAEPAAWTAAALMTAGLLAKTALFPLHLWLPPAHAGAPAAASAVLSALVVKGSFFIAVRLWFDVMPALPGLVAAQMLAALGASAILFGSVLALRQERLKLLVAYSTVAQLGYLFLMFPLAFSPAGGRLVSAGALAAGILQAMSHATAKAAMFMAAGLMYAALGHDRITGLAGIGRALPLSVLAFALGGVALMGVPPSGAYVAKELLLGAADETGQWWWAFVLQAGAFFTSGYLFVVLVHALTPADGPLVVRARVPVARQAAALALALSSLCLGLISWGVLLPVAPGSVSNPLTLAAFVKSLWPVLGGVVVAILLGRWRDPPPRVPLSAAAGALVAPLRRAVLGVSGAVEDIDGVLRQWPLAGLALLLVAIMFGAAMLAAGGRL